MTAKRKTAVDLDEGEDLREMIRQVAARLESIEARLVHQEELAELRIQALERAQSDHETRLRASADAVVRLTTMASLAQVAQAAFALGLSAVAAWLGRR